METYDINNLVNFVVVSRKSAKGNIYQALCIQIKDKNGDIVIEKVIDFLTHSQYENVVNVLSLLKK